MPDLSLPPSRIPLSIVDVETTGLWAEQGHRVCEIAVVRAQDGRELEAFHSLVQPGRPIDEDARSVNGITDLELADAPTFDALIEDLDRVLEGTVLVAHNAPFDVSFLVAEYEIARRAAPDIPVIDTLAISRRLLGNRRNDLGSVARSLGVPLGERHRALADARATLGILMRMTDILAPRGVVSTADLLAAQQQSVALRPPQMSRLPAPLVEAVNRRHPVTICYVDAGGNATERTVEPLWANRVYLIAWCRQQKAQRTFRLDRIVDAWLC